MSRYYLCSAGILALLLLVGGCGSPAFVTADADRARAALQTALETWKKGEDPATLQNQTPPIWFNEHASKGASKLLAYKLDDKITMRGPQVRCVAVLTLQDIASGRKTERTIPYLVDTTPNCVIAREGL